MVPWWFNVDPYPNGARKSQERPWAEARSRASSRDSRRRSPGSSRSSSKSSVHNSRPSSRKGSKTRNFSKAGEVGVFVGSLFLFFVVFGPFFLPRKGNQDPKGDKLWERVPRKSGIHKATGWRLAEWSAGIVSTNLWACNADVSTSEDKLAAGPKYEGGCR